MFRQHWRKRYEDLAEIILPICILFFSWEMAARMFVRNHPHIPPQRMKQNSFTAETLGVGGGGAQNKFAICCVHTLKTLRFQVPRSRGNQRNRRCDVRGCVPSCSVSIVAISDVENTTVRGPLNGGVFKRGGFPIWTCPSFFVLFRPFWDFPDFCGIFPI